MKTQTYPCPICGGKVFKEKVKVDLWIKDKLIVIEKVPADVCSVCGEEAFSPSTSKKIDGLLKKEKKPKGETLVPIFSFAS